MKYESTVHKASLVRPGVGYRIRRMSFGRRIELTRSIRETISRQHFLEAGPQGAEQEAEAALLAAEIDREYLKWGLEEVTGLEIDGAPATPDLFIGGGPEDIVAEALGFVLAEAGLSESERKNSESHSTLAKTVSPGGDATTVEGTDSNEDAAAVGCPASSVSAQPDRFGSVR